MNPIAGRTKIPVSIIAPILVINVGGDFLFSVKGGKIPRAG